MLLTRAVTALSLLVSVAAQAADPSLFQHLHWRLVGPFRGGRVLAVAGVPGEPQHFYFGAVNGGVWETLDAGRTWQPIFDKEPVGSIGAIALAPSDARTIYVGTGESDMRSDIAQGSGVYKSTDGGKTWAFCGLADTQQIGRIIVHPQDANLVYLAALGHPYAANAERGVFRSRDGGKNWRKILGPNADTGAIDLAFQPGEPNVIYAALWQTRRPPWNVYPPPNGPGSGLYKSTDGGEHWTHIGGHGFPAAVGRIGLAISAAAPQRIYALVDGVEGGLYRSDDGGKNWTRKSSDVRIWQRDWYFGELAADPLNPDRIYVPNTIMLRSDDGGATFEALKGDNTGDDFHAMWIDPHDPQRQMLGIDQGAIVTLNGGKTWSSWYNQPTAQIYHISTDNRFPYWIYGTQQDSGPIGLPNRSADHNGISMMQFREMTVGGEADNIAPDPDDPQTVFGGRVDKLDLRTDQVRHVDPTMAVPDIYRRTWTLPLTFSPRRPHVLYFANQRLYRTADHGEHWETISPDLARPDPGVPANLDALTAADNLGKGPRRGVIYTIAPSPLADGLIWTGTDDGLIWRTRDSGKHWDNVTPKSLAAWSKIGIIDASPFDPDSAYAAVDRHRLDDQKPYIFRTHDGGNSWQKIVTGLPDQAINVVRADPERRGLLFAGSERGVFVSFDDGEHWQALQLNLPVTSVRDITIHDRDVIIATHGRGIWILDDISALRQLDAAIEHASAWLFAPAPAYRVRIAPFSGTPLPKEEPAAANPELGAFLDYTLRSESKAPITLDILTEDGSPVRHYSSADKPPASDAKKSQIAMEWVEHPITLSTSAGAHRFVWPLRYRGVATDKSDNPAYIDGAWAPPGHYRAVLTVDGQKLSQPLTVQADPRIDLPAAAYAAQFALAQRIESERAGVAIASQQVDDALAALAKARTDAPKLTSEIERFVARVHELAGTRAEANPHNAWAFPANNTRSLLYVSGELEDLELAVDGSDAAPSPDAQHGFDALLPLIDSALKSWDQFKTRELSELNAKLKAAGKEEIKIASD